MSLLKYVSDKEINIYDCKFVYTSNGKYRSVNDLYAMHENGICKIVMFDNIANQFEAKDVKSTNGIAIFDRFPIYIIKFTNNISENDPYILIGSCTDYVSFTNDIKFRILTKEKYNKIKDLL